MPRLEVCKFAEETGLYLICSHSFVYLNAAINLLYANYQGNFVHFGKLLP